MNEQTKHNLLNMDIWIRLFYMLVFSFLLCIARIVIFTVAMLQALFVLITAGSNQNLRELGQIASKWSLQVFYFLTFNSDQKPFPFDDWPELDVAEASEQHQTSVVEQQEETVTPIDEPDSDDKLAN